MSNKQLPPKLVEKLGKIVMGKDVQGIDFLLKNDPEILEQCAQIAVDYANHEVDCAMDYATRKILSLLSNSGLSVEQRIAFSDAVYMHVKTKREQLLKKYEDEK